MIKIEINHEQQLGNRLIYDNVTKEEVDELRRIMDFFDKSIKNITLSEEVIKKINEFYDPKIGDIKYSNGSNSFSEKMKKSYDDQFLCKNKISIFDGFI